MDIKDLNKSQLILLAVLLSFVTSIATGITTVTLMQQAPDSVTVPINRVIRQTVEKIQQVEGKTQTVIVKEEDLVVDAIAKNQGAIFSLTKNVRNDEGEMVEISVGQGLVVNDKGIVVADTVLTGENGTFFAKNASGKFRAEIVHADIKGFSFIKIGSPLAGTDKLAFTMPTFGDIANMKAGQKFIIFSNAISSFIYDGNKEMKIAVIRGNSGAPILNLDGEVLGITLFNEVTPFASATTITESLKASNIE